MSTHPAVGTALAVGLGTLVALAGAGRRTTLSAAALLAAAHSVDAEHWVRMVLVELLFAWRRRCGVASTDVLKLHRAVHMCWPIDLDQNSHMNNAKYAKLLNFARRAFWLENGVWAACARHSPPATMVVTATALRYRRQIRCFERFLVVTRLLCWDHTAFYLEHRFENIADGFVSCAPAPPAVSWGGRVPCSPFCGLQAVCGPPPELGGGQHDTHTALFATPADPFLWAPEPPPELGGGQHDAQNAQQHLYPLRRCSRRAWSSTGRSPLPAAWRRRICSRHAPRDAGMLPFYLCTILLLPIMYGV